VISQNQWITKLEAGLEPETTVETTKNPPDCVSQNVRTKSKKAGWWRSNLDRL